MAWLATDCLEGHGVLQAYIVWDMRGVVIFFVGCRVSKGSGQCFWRGTCDHKANKGWQAAKRISKEALISGHVGETWQSGSEQYLW